VRWSRRPPRSAHLNRMLESARALPRRGDTRRLTNDIAYFEQRRHHPLLHAEFKCRHVPPGGEAAKNGVRRVPCSIDPPTAATAG